MDWERLKAWNVNREPADAGDKSDLILGAIACAWEDRPHLKHSIYSAIPAFADRAYNLEPITDEQSFNTALSRFVLGPSLPHGVNIFGRYLKEPLMFDNVLTPICDGVDTEEAKVFFSSLTHLSANEELARRAYLKWL